MHYISILALAGTITALISLNNSVEAISIKQSYTSPTSTKLVRQIVPTNNYDFGYRKLLKQGMFKPKNINSLEPIDSESNFNKFRGKVEEHNSKLTNKDSNFLISAIISAKQEFNSPIPNLITSTVLQNLSQLTLSSISNFSIVKVENKTWSNNCLNIPMPGVMCTQSMVPGWQVTVFGKQQKWVYHTSNKGAVVLNGLASLPSSLATAILLQTSQKTQLPISKLNIMSVEPRIWSNGCLNVVSPGVMCTQSMTPGWRVTVSNGTKRWVYHTDLSSKIRLNVAASI